MVPLRRKLLLNNIAVVLLTFAGVGVIVSRSLDSLSDSFFSQIQKRTEQAKSSLEKSFHDRAEKIRTVYATALEEKGRNLVQKDAASVQAMVEDNSFTGVREFLAKNFRGDNEIVEAAFFVVEGKEINAWQYVSRKYPQGLNLPIVYHAESKSWSASTPGGKKVKIPAQDVPELARLSDKRIVQKGFSGEGMDGTQASFQVLDCVNPVYKKNSSPKEISEARKTGKAVGYLHYVLSMERMEKTLADERKSLDNEFSALDRENADLSEKSRLLVQESLHRSFVVLGVSAVIAFILAYFMTWVTSLKVTQPVKRLREIAESMAQGNYRQDVDVATNDEIGILASSFREMSQAITKRDEDLAEINRNLEKLVDERTRQLKEELRNIGALLDNMRQAVFSVGKDGRIMPPVSGFAETVFGGSIDGHHVLEAVYKDIDPKSEVYAAIQTFLSVAFGEGKLQWRLIEDSLPREIQFWPQGSKNTSEPRVLKIAYSPLWSETDTLDKVLFVAEDITEVLRLTRKVEAERAASARTVGMLQEMVALERGHLRDYLTGSASLLQESEASGKALSSAGNGLDVILRNVHTVKGNSRLFNLSFASSLIHRREQEIVDGIAGYRDNKVTVEELKRTIREALAEIQAQVGEYGKLAKEVLRIEDAAKTEKDGFVEVQASRIEKIKGLVDGRSSSGEILRALDRLTDHPVQPALTAYRSMVQELSVRLGKKVQLRVDGDELFLGKEQLKLLNDSMVHMVRNSLDHGIELPGERTNARKSESGTINIHCKDLGQDAFEITVEDDGRGVDGEVVAKCAVARGRLSGDAVRKLTPKQKQELIFLPEFSTKDEVSDLSGRGVGMDVVKTNFEKMGWVLELSSTPGKGTKFTVRGSPAGISGKSKAA